MHTASFNVFGETQRLTLAALPAAIITNVILLVMLSLIATDYPDLPEGGIKVQPVVMPPPPPPEVLKEAPPGKPLEPLETPKWEPTEVKLEFDDALTYSPGPAEDFKRFDEGIKTGEGGGIVAYLKVEPIYPSRALSRGTEGYVDLSFDITAAGSTSNIRIIASEPQGVFDQAAVNALRKWKYKVPEEDGVATGQRDMMTRISFAIDG